MNSAQLAETLDSIASLGREKSFAEIGQLLVDQDEITLYSLVETDLGVSSNEYGSSTSAGALTTLFMFKGASTLIEKGAASAGQRALGAIAAACVAQVCEDSMVSEEEMEEGAATRKWAAVCDQLLESLPQQSPRSVIDISFRILAELKTCGSTPSPFHGFLPMLLDTLGAIGQVEILTKGQALAAASTQDKNAGDQSSVMRSGSSLKAYWVDSACAYRWDPKSSVAVCALLREIVLSDRQIQSVAKRMLRQLKMVEYTELPAMVYQLLLFARKGLKHEIIAGIFEVFDALENESMQHEQRKRWRELGDIEGTVMLHINYSIKQDFELGSALIAYGKDKSEMAVDGSAHGISAFSFACLLSLARIHRFEKDVSDLLRAAILRSINDRISLETTSWARPYVPAMPFDAQRLLKATVARASYGWDQVTQSLIQLCLGLIDYTYSAAKRSSKYSHEALVESRQLCMETLRTAFSGHAFVRAELVDQILSRVMFQEESHECFLDLLRHLASDDHESLRDYHSKIVSVFDSISVITPATVEKLLTAAVPIILDDSQFRSSLLLVLRKILFTHSIDDRRTALSGLFVLAKCFVVDLDTCQVQNMDERVRKQRADMLMSVLLEILGLLRRCFMQQPEVRTMSYERLALMLDDPCVGRNRFFLNALCGTMQSEFAKYYNENKAYESPINITQCINPTTHKVVMPISSFLQCLAKLASNLAATGLGSNPTTSSSSSSAATLLVQSSQDIWKDVCVRFSKTQIEDFELDPTGDYSIGDPVGLRNYNTALMVSGCLDASLEQALTHCIQGEACQDCSNGNCELGSPEMAMKLFSKFARIADVLCSLCLDDRKKRIISSPSELSLMSLQQLARVLQLVLPDKHRLRNEMHPLNTPENGHAWYVSSVDKASLWSGNQAFIKHILEVTLARVSCRLVASRNINFSTNVTTSLPAPDTKVLLRTAYIVYNGVLAYYVNSQGAADMDVELPVYLRTRSSTRGRSVLQLSAELLLSCASMLSTNDMLDEMAAAVLVPHSSPIAREEATAQLLSNLCTMVTAFLSQKPVAAKEAVHILSLMNLLALRLSRLSSLPSVDSHVQGKVYRSISSVVGWGLRIVFGEIPEDSSLLKALFVLLTTCQPFLQPMELLFSSGALANMSHGNEPDLVELAPVNQIVSTVRSASKIQLADTLNDSGMNAKDKDDNEEEEEPNLEVFTLRTIPALITVISMWFKAEIHRIEWVISQLSRCVRIETASRPPHDSADLSESIVFERRVCLRVRSLAQILDQLLSIHFTGKVSGDLVIRSLNDLHKIFLLLTKTKLSCTELPITEEYIDALSLICQNLNTRAYSMFLVKYTGSGDAATGSGSFASADAKGLPLAKGDGSKGKGKEKSFAGVTASRNAKSKVLRDSALVSSLVFQMEQTEKHVMQLSTKFKVPLAHHLKRSTARDFRIEAAAIPNPIMFQDQQLGEPEEEEDDDDDEEEEENANMPSHRRQSAAIVDDEDLGSSDEETEVLLDVDVSENASNAGTGDADVMDLVDVDVDADSDENMDDGQYRTKRQRRYR
ncbi:hypothetical protein LPJ81_002103 [Coemansia sp. IMI 209127]|nr:hypothetical protein LPJ81_002103 [Coemansia sp. IMI 209127]